MFGVKNAVDRTKNLASRVMSRGKAAATAVGTGAMVLATNVSAQTDVTAVTGAFTDAGTGVGTIAGGMLGVVAAGIAVKWVLGFIIG